MAVEDFIDEVNKKLLKRRTINDIIGISRSWVAPRNVAQRIVIHNLGVASVEAPIPSFSLLCLTQVVGYGKGIDAALKDAVKQLTYQNYYVPYIHVEPRLLDCMRGRFSNLLRLNWYNRVAIAVTHALPEGETQHASETYPLLKW